MSRFYQPHPLTLRIPAATGVSQEPLPTRDNSQCEGVNKRKSHADCGLGKQQNPQSEFCNLHSIDFPLSICYYKDV